MNEEQAAKKPRKALGPVELYAADPDGITLTKIEPQPPQDLKSADAYVRWLKQNAQIDGRYVFMRKLVGVDLVRTQVERVDVTLV
jgi:hypothetical protein